MNLFLNLRLLCVWQRLCMYLFYLATCNLSSSSGGNSKRTSES
jgi:hypothetical protein